MLEKWRQWAIKMNFKKAVIFFFITGFAATVGFSAAVYSNFRGRISEWEQLSEADEDHGREEKKTVKNTNLILKTGNMMRILKKEKRRTWKIF